MTAADLRTVDEWRRAVEKRLGWKEGESSQLSPGMVREAVRKKHPDLYEAFDHLDQPIWLGKPIHTEKDL